MGWLEPVSAAVTPEVARARTIANRASTAVTKALVLLVAMMLVMNEWRYFLCIVDVHHVAAYSLLSPPFILCLESFGVF